MSKIRIATLIGVAGAFCGLAQPALAGHGVPPRPLQFSWANSTDPVRDESAAEAAMREVGRAQSSLLRTNLQLCRQFLTSPEYAQAAGAARDARIAFEQARDAALTSLHDSTEYRSARLQIWKLEQELNAARNLPTVQRNVRVAELALQLMAQRSAISKLESAELTKSDSLTDVRNAMIDSQRSLSAMRQSFDATIKTDASFVAAREELDAARQRLASIN